MVENKTILVTGASSGIGLSIVKLLANSKAKVVLTARNESKLQKAISTLEGEGHIYIVADLEHDNNLDFWKNRKPKEFNLLYEGYDKEPEYNLFQEAFYISDSE